MEFPSDSISETFMLLVVKVHTYVYMHGLRIPNECINQRNLKIWADVVDKICFGRT